MEKGKNVSVISAIKKASSYAKPYTLWIIANIAALVFTVVINIATTYYINGLTDMALALKFKQSGMLLAFIVPLILAGSALAWLSTYSSARYVAYTMRDLRSRLAGHMQRLPVSYMEKFKSGDMISRLNNDTELFQNFVKGMPDFIYQPLLFLSSFIYMAYISRTLALLTAFLMIFSVVVVRIMTKPMRANYKKIQEHLALATSLLSDTIGGVCMQKVFGLREVLYLRYLKALKKWLDTALKVEKRIAGFSFLRSISSLTPIIVCNSYGAYLSLNGQISPGKFLAYTILTSYMTGSISSISGIITNIYTMAAASERIFEIMDADTDSEDRVSPEAVPSAPAIEFEGVSFSYDGKVQVFNDLSFNVEVGSVTAMAGLSGSGKSTVFKLLCGFHTLFDGCIRLFGNKLDSYNPSDVRRMLSVVSQDIYLFPVTIAENIAYGRVGASREDIISAAKMANAHEFIMELPDGYDTPAGERGVRLSAGQRQRIAIARAIIKDSPVLLLDEPTSALDTQSEALIQEALKRFMKGRTVFIIAHRLSTIINADKIMVLEHGRIAETGTHEELLENGGSYRNLFERQFAQGYSLDLQGVKADA